MRKFTFNEQGIKATVDAPNETCFAFSPQIYRFRQDATSVGIKSVTATMSCYSINKTFTETRELFQGECVFDLSQYFQMMFDHFDRAPYYNEVGITYTTSDIENLNTVAYTNKYSFGCGWRQINVEFSCITTTGLSKNFNTSIVSDVSWGCLDVNEQFGGQYHRKWFLGYPFTLNFTTQKNGYFDITVNDTDTQRVPFAFDQNQNWFHITANPDKLLDMLNVHKLHITAPKCKLLKNDIETIDVMSYTLDVCRNTSGVYLRWFDRQCNECYYLFDKKSTVFTISETKTFLRNDTSVPTSYVNGQNKATQKRQNIAKKEVIALGTSFANEEEYAFLVGLVQSPIVDVFKGRTNEGVPMWQRVNIMPGSYTEVNVLLQDFNLSIEMPVQNSQTM